VTAPARRNTIDTGWRLHEYRTSLEAKDRSPQTIRAYVGDVRTLARFALERGAESPESVDRRLLRRYLAHLADRGDQRSSVVRRVAAIRVYFGWLVQRGAIDEDPTRTLRVGAAGSRLPDLVVRQQLDELLEANWGDDPWARRDRALFEVLYGAGLRVSELCALDMVDVDQRAGTVRVLGKGRKERVVPLHRTGLAALAAWMGAARTDCVTDETPGAALFLNRRGRRLGPRDVRRVLDARVRHGHVHPHALRHTYATHMLKGGADLRVVQELLGHESLTTTQIYTHVSKSQLQNVHRQTHPRGRPRPTE
jgi:site-specific recombinase XerD